MASPFDDACRQAARDLRRLPAELRRNLGHEVRDTVADPLAAEIRAEWSGPRAAVLRAATKTRPAADPTIAVVGRRPVLSGGASIQDIAYGEEFGGGKRVAAIPATGRRRGHRRRTTRQFRAGGQHAIFGTVEARMDQTFDRWSDAVAKIVGRMMGNG